jgi:hypothetical protein
VVASEALSEICQEFGDELVNGPVGSFPRVDVSQIVWMQPDRNAFVRDRDERAGSSDAAMSAIYAVLKMFYSRQDSYVGCMLELQRAQAAQRRLRVHVHRHKRAARDAQHHIDNAMMALEARRVQFMNTVAKRDKAHAQRMQIMHERDEAICLAETREATGIRTVFAAGR